MVVQKVMNFEQILYGRAAQLGPRYQNVAASYNSYRQKLVQAQQTDQIGDQNVAVARNLVQPLVDIVGNLKSVKAEMESIVATVEKLLGETEEFPNENPSAALNLKMKTHGQLQTHSQNLQSLCSKNHELCNQLRSLGQSIINSFRASYHTAMNGMTQGQMFYSNLDKAITQLERTG
uniref:Uncharacterized protein n=1 Tax=Coptotermes formosanus TaxID=36987 RepID=R4UL89_COPFO|nr:hypothetical protein [Coptotermes formosanus]